MIQVDKNIIRYKIGTGGTTVMNYGYLEYS